MAQEFDINRVFPATNDLVLWCIYDNGGVSSFPIVAWHVGHDNAMTPCVAHHDDGGQAVLFRDQPFTCCLVRRGADGAPDQAMIDTAIRDLKLRRSTYGTA